MENCVAPGLDKFDLLLEHVLSLVRVLISLYAIPDWTILSQTFLLHSVLKRRKKIKYASCDAKLWR